VDAVKKYDYPLPAYAISFSRAYDILLQASGCRAEANLDLATFDELLTAADFRFRKALYRAELIAYVLDDDNNPCSLRSDAWSTALPEGHSAEIFVGIDFVGPDIPTIWTANTVPGKVPRSIPPSFFVSCCFRKMVGNAWCRRDIRVGDFSAGGGKAFIATRCP
jgi:hypothetical protein